MKNGEKSQMVKVSYTSFECNSSFDRVTLNIPFPLILANFSSVTRNSSTNSFRFFLGQLNLRGMSWNVCVGCRLACSQFRKCKQMFYIKLMKLSKTLRPVLSNRLSRAKSQSFNLKIYYAFERTWRHQFYLVKKVTEYK